MNKCVTLHRMVAFLVVVVLAGCTTEVVTVESGQVVGLRLGGDRDVEVFKGIPYAAPPVGDMRWRPPAPAEPWTGVLECFDYGPSCPQPPRLGGQVDALFTSEDCLYLNVWRPGDAQGKRLPVMVWIHGGGFQGGSSSLYDAEALAARGVVVVTVNYRLGHLGFLAHPALSDESEAGVSGNYGLLDQIFALAWVRDNIAAFGGDPGNVTVFGESAGSMSVACLLASPLASGLFHKAIMQSGVPWRLDVLRGQETNNPPAEEDGLALAAGFGIAGTGAEAAAALRALTPGDLVGAAPAPEVDTLLPYAPNIDGVVLVGHPLVAMRAGDFNRVPLLIGTNEDEISLFLVLQTWLKALSEARYMELVHAFFGPWAADVLRFYPPDVADVEEQANRALSDYLMFTPARLTARAVAAHGNPVYTYYFTRAPNNVLGEVFGAFHAAEIPYLFGIPGGSADWTTDDFALADAMKNYWTRFAATGNPNGGGDSHWPAYDRVSDGHLELGQVIAAGNGLLREPVALFEAILIEALTP